MVVKSDLQKARSNEKMWKMIINAHVLESWLKKNIIEITWNNKIVYIIFYDFLTRKFKPQDVCKRAF